MTQILKLIFTTQPCNNVTGEIQKDTDFGKVLDMIFDNVPLKGNKTYSLYNNLLVDIRNARRNNVSFIDMTKSDLNTLKEILLAAIDGNPRLNRPVSFLTEVIEKAMINGTAHETTHDAPESKVEN